MSLVDTREIATAKIVMLGGTGGSNVEGNPTGSATEYLSKLQIDDTIFETAGVIPFDVTLINNSDIHISAVNAGQLDGKTILINTTTHTGTTPAGWFLKINQSTSYEMITPEGRSFKDDMSDNMAMIVRLDASQAEATVLGVLGADSSDVVSGLGIGKKTSVSNNVIITDIDLHRAPMAGDRLLIWFDASVQNPTGLTTYNNGTAVTSNLENVSPLFYNAGWNIVQFMNDGLLYNNVWVRKQNVPLPISTLSGLSDTAIASPSDGQLLTYDNDTQKWKNKTYVEANTGFPVTELKKLKVGNVVYDTDGMKNYSVTNVASNNITVSVLNSNQFVQEVIAINTGNHTGSSSAWNLVLTDGMNPVSVALKNADGTAFADDIHENELLFVYVDTAGNVARVLEIHSHDLEVLKDICITEKTVSGNPIVITDALPYPAVSLSAEIEASQDLHGYDYPWVGGSGKNFIDYSAQHNTTVGVSYTNNPYSGEIKVDYASGGQHQLVLSVPNVDKLKGQRVTLSVDNVVPSNARMNDWRIFLLTYINGGSESIVVTLSSNTLKNDVVISNNITEMRLLLRMSQSGGSSLQSGDYVTFNKVQLELGGDKTSYAPYSNICPISGRTAVTITDYDSESNIATVTVQLGQTVYGGTLNLTTGELTITWGSVDMGGLSYSSDNISGKGQFYGQISTDYKYLSSGIAVKSDRYKGINGGTSFQDYNNGEIAVSNTQAYPLLRFRDDNFIGKTPTEAQTALTGVYVLLELVTPQTIQLTPTDLQMLKGYNRLSSDGGGDMSITYKADRLAAIEAALAAL